MDSSSNYESSDDEAINKEPSPHSSDESEGWNSMPSTVGANDLGWSSQIQANPPAGLA
jgi:hypothetical protein